MATDSKAEAQVSFSSLEKWNYEALREYLIAQERNVSFLPSLEGYPESIELSSDWHDVLNTMRELTRRDEH